MTPTQFIVVLLSSGVLASLVAGIIANKRVKDQRVFNTKFKVYADFIGHLGAHYVDFTLPNPDKNRTILEMNRISSKCILVTTDEIREKIVDFNAFISSMEAQKMKVETEDGTDYVYPVSMWKKVEQKQIDIENLMREDLGFCREGFFKKIQCLKPVIKLKIFK